jgi:hypothetical protein
MTFAEASGRLEGPIRTSYKANRTVSDFFLAREGKTGSLDTRGEDDRRDGQNGSLLVKWRINALIGW